MNFKQCNSTNYKRGRTDKISYIVVHYTGNNGDTAKNNADYFSRAANIKSSAHYFVDENEIWQSVADRDTAYHCGAYKYTHPHCRNSNSLGVEMCSRFKDGICFIPDKTVLNAVNLVKKLMTQYGINKCNILRHYDVTGKKCPLPFVENPSLWNKFTNQLGEIKVIETGNDIDYALKVKYNISFDSLENEREFIKELDSLRKKDSKLYWVLYKLANK